MARKWKWMAGISCICLIGLAAGCAKKKPLTAVPVTPKTEAPVVAQQAPPPPLPIPAAQAEEVIPPPAPPQPAAAALTLRERLAGEVGDVYFDFDKSTLREDARQALTHDAAALKSILRDFSTTTVVVEGHCDERGSAEYNIALGDRRATVAKEFLSEMGVAAERLITISYGKERLQCAASTEECWQKNRRVHFAPGEEQRKLLSQAEAE